MILIICLSILVYTYWGYPLILLLLSYFKQNKVIKNPYEPRVSILISAYNEQRHIKATIENKLALDYTKENLEVIVISDGSDDQTDAIVKEFANQGVQLIRQLTRKGKTSALNRAVPLASGEILVFSDANSIYAPDALRRLVQNFTDPTVGYVTGKMIYVNPDGTMIGAGCSTYMKYENILRTLETKLGSIVGVDGGIDAVRKNLYQPMKADQLPDFVLPLMVVEQGYRVIYEPTAILKEQTLASPYDEYKMRVRVSLRALWALHDMKKLLDVRQYGLFSWQLFSHKYLRYLAFIFMAGAYTFNALILPRSRINRIFFLVQNVVYGSALIAHFLLQKGKKAGLLYIPYYFVLINIAAGHAFIRFCRGEKQVVWTPRKG